MDDTIGFILLWVAALVVGVRVLIAFLVFRVVTRIRLGRGGYTLVAESAVPEALRAAWEPASAELSSVGLAPEAYVRVRGADQDEFLARLFRAPDGGTRALLAFAVVGDDVVPSATFYSPLASGRSVLTMNARSFALIGEVPATVVVDPMRPALPDQWRAHADAVARQGEPVAPLPVADHLDRLDENLVRQLAGGVQSGRLAIAADGSHALTLRGALGLTRQILRARGRQTAYAREQAAWRKANPHLAAAPIDESCAFTRRMRRSRCARPSGATTAPCWR